MRTGRARPSLVETLKVDYYGTPTPLNQMAAINAPDPRLITIQPWDKTQLGTIEKAIQKSDLGLTPTNDGNIIRLVVPPLTEDRRKELVKTVHKKAEDARVAVRNVRRDSLEQLRKAQHDKTDHRRRRARRAGAAAEDHRQVRRRSRQARTRRKNKSCSKCRRGHASRSGRAPRSAQIEPT